MTPEEKKERLRSQQRAHYDRNKERYQLRYLANKQDPGWVAKQTARAVEAKAKNAPQREEKQAARAAKRVVAARKADARKRESLLNRRPARIALKQCRQRARQNGILFSLEEKDAVVPEFCPVLGVRLVRGVAAWKRGHSPSIDRLHPRLGYVASNIRVISSRANLLKTNASPAEMYLVFLDYVRLHGMVAAAGPFCPLHDSRFHR